MNKLNIKELQNLKFKKIKRGKELKSLLSNKNIINYEQAGNEKYYEITLKNKKILTIELID